MIYLDNNASTRMDSEVAAALDGAAGLFGNPSSVHGEGRRARRAIEEARGGDQRYVASPRVDSYHGIWFELHEDLIQLAGRNRADEVAAGRA